MSLIKDDLEKNQQQSGSVWGNKEVETFTGVTATTEEENNVYGSVSRTS